jgi:histidyl-tRNA synthetase
VKKEMISEKGLDPAVADKIGEYVKHKGSVIYYSRPKNSNPDFFFILVGPDLLARLENDASLTSNKSAKQGLTDMGILFTLLKAYDVLDKVDFIGTVLGMVVDKQESRFPSIFP